MQQLPPYGHLWLPYRFCPTEISLQVFCLRAAYAQPLTLQGFPLLFQFTISPLIGFCDQNYIVGERHAPWYGLPDGFRDFFYNDRKNEQT